ncbi:MAG: MFS transporter, partial [Chloroflexi bacterium]|nr:MFS transporter [Chloroflexota bacterium]
IAYGGLYTFPALSVAFAAEFGISRTLAVAPWTMFLVVTAIASPLLGRAYDEWADRDLLTASMVLLAAGWLAVYLAQEISLLILAYAVFMALGLQLSFIGTSTAIARRYEGVSGLALGIAYAGPGIGVAIALPVAAGLIATAGWRSTSLVFLATCLVGVVFVWLMTSGPAIVVPTRKMDRRRTTAPSDVMGAAPPASPTVAGPSRSTHRPSLAIGEPMSAGQLDVRGTEAVQAAHATGLHEMSAPGAVSAAREILPVGSGEHRHGIRRVVRTRRFWILFAGAAAIGVFDEGVLQAFIPSSVQSGLGAGWAATALGLQSLAYVGGQIVGGWLSDHVDRRIVGVTAAAAVGGGVVAALGVVGSVPTLAVAGIIVHGIGTGATIAVRSAAFGDVFGGPNFGTIFGLLSVAYPIGGTFAVYFGAISVDATGSYAPLIPVVVAALAVWSVALWIAGPRRVRGPARGSPA